MLRSIRALLRRRAPLLAWVWRRTKLAALGGGSTGRVFAAIYRRRAWGRRGSRSGSGSTLERTRAVRAALPPLLRRLGCRSLLDIPCGDFLWMQSVDLGGIDYTGADIVEEIVEANARLHAAAHRRFLRLDLTRDELPPADLVLCRDCLVHLSNERIRAAIANIARSRSTYLLTTTFVGRRANEDVPTGAWRPLNLQLPPFALPQPIEVISEAHPDPEYADKTLALWRVSDLPDLG
jgi:SAM-dependent methyltransferase